ncbi:hypothetical protein BHM03_00036236 [Ensete ventricosum]|nr:hypothetical protein BHM03_00036236 [Ensete ventricosum]
MHLHPLSYLGFFIGPISSGEFLTLTRWIELEVSSDSNLGTIKIRAFFLCYSTAPPLVKRNRFRALSASRFLAPLFFVGSLSSPTGSLLTYQSPLTSPRQMALPLCDRVSSCFLAILSSEPSVALDFRCCFGVLVASIRTHHRRKAGLDQFDSSDADSVSSVSTGLSELTLGNETEYVNSQEFELEKYIDALYEKRPERLVTRRRASKSRLGAGPSGECSSLSLPLSPTYEFDGPVASFCCRSVCSSFHCRGRGPQVPLPPMDALWSFRRCCCCCSQHCRNCLKLILHRCCRQLFTVVFSPLLLSLSVSFYCQLRRSKNFHPPYWQRRYLHGHFFLQPSAVGESTLISGRSKPIMFLSTLLEDNDRSVRIAAGEAIAIFFQLGLLDQNDHVEIDGVDHEDSKHRVFGYMQSMKAKILYKASELSVEAGGKGTDKKNLNDQRDLFQKILDYVQERKQGQFLPQDE